ncbi:MAG: hypothetical protein N2449_03850 [Bacteroidales bacterium]|nr:hypothetical protein [Bacteroidales bacterium]
MKNQMNLQKSEKKIVGLKSLVLGLIIILAGILLLLHNLNLIDPYWFNVFFSWQMAVAVVGFIFLFGKDYPFGIFIFVLGVLLVMSHHFNLDINITTYLLPLIIIAIGLVIVYYIVFSSKRQNKQLTTDQQNIEEINLFGSGNYIINSQSFKYGKFICIFSGSKINLLQSDITQMEAEINVIAIFGGINLYIPPDWIVKFETFNVFGGFSDSRNISISNSTKILVIKGIILFGGGEIKSIPD